MNNKTWNDRVLGIPRSGSLPVKNASEVYVATAKPMVISYAKAGEGAGTTWSCEVFGAFTPEADTDYEANTYSSGGQCAMGLAKLKLVNGVVERVPVKLEDAPKCPVEQGS